jgi:hypothetical protein
MVVLLRMSPSTLMIRPSSSVTFTPQNEWQNLQMAVRTSDMMISPRLARPILSLCGWAGKWLGSHICQLIWMGGSGCAGLPFSLQGC